MGEAPLSLGSPDTANHFENNILRIEKWDAQKPWTAVVIDADNNRHAYIKRFEMDAIKNHRNFVGENPDSQLLILSDVAFPRIQVTFGGADSFREPLEIDCEEFVAVKGFKAKGKRISTFAIDSVAELAPLRFPEVSENTDENDGSSSEEEENLDPDAGKSQQDVLDELTGQLNLFD